jgi:medium-chain acyl-[acyl-carrier-protein] hydrolase
VTWRPAPAARLRLFCLPHTGGGAVTYRWWAQQLAPEVEVIAIRLPGRETRLREPPFTRLTELVPALVQALEPWLDRPHAWLGHSMGALIAFEACRLSRRRGLTPPLRLIVAGRRAPHLPDREPPVHDAPTADLLARLRGLSGTPREVLDDGQALATLLPVLRADYAVSETYRWRPEPPLDCPISVLGGESDPLTTDEELHGWCGHTSTGCTVQVVAGGHFFLHHAGTELLPVIRDHLLSPPPPAGYAPTESASPTSRTPTGRPR